MLGSRLVYGGPGWIDFVAFQAAGRLALAGDAAAAYDDERLRQVQAEILTLPEEALGGYLGWLNPPHFFFVVIPSALLSYAHGWTLWILLSVVALALGLRAVMPGAPALVAVLALPATLFCLGVGQNGLLVAALFAAAVGLLDRRPVVAGIALGLLTIKPQFGLLFPLVLALTGRWRVFAVACVTAVLAAGTSALAFGPEPWPAFVAQLGSITGRYLANATPVLPKIQSVHAFLVHMTGSPGLAVIGHGAVALAVAAVVLRIWLRRPEGPEEARAAALIAGAFLVTPYVWTYDMPALGVAALFLVRAGLRDGFLSGERALLLVAVLLPAVIVANDVSLHGPAACLVVLGLAWRRDRAWRRAAAFSPAPSATAS
ncbi:glycosyltransferase family 87 protein [Roseomonas sp. HF4]|uniref:glycosyltransferase family 87 protein n=1 Tax=Roseomonas sp. HF4 TaxID=2562313 RepID=UPI00148568B9|nr:glycosyltransferase family 87 protein [Roseomonas sp. HF4]